MNVFDAVFSNNISQLRKYLANGDVNVKNERGMSLIHYAIIFNNSEIFDLLLENFININIQDKYGDTPAVIASRKMLDAAGVHYRRYIRSGRELKIIV